MNDLLKKIKSYVDTHHPVIYLEALFELDADEIIIQLSKKNNMDIIEYSHGYVYGYENGCKKEYSKACLSDFLDNRFKSDDINKLIVLKDIHRYLLPGENMENIDVLFRLKSLVYKLIREDGDSNSIIFIVSPSLVIPNELTKFITVFSINPPSEKEVLATIDDFCSIQGCGIDNELKIEVSNRLKGLSLYEVKKILALAYENDGKISHGDFLLISEQKSQMVKKNGVLEMVNVKVDKTSIGGLENLMTWVEGKNKIFERLAEAKSKKIDPPKGVMLVGLPGCGKSLSAEVIASIMKIPLLRLDMGKLLGKYVGESEENMRRAIHLAEAVSPCVLWIDEIEKAFVGVGGDSGGSDVSKRMFGSFLTWMQEKSSPVFVIATANDITTLPPELLRKGRFDEIFSVGLPNVNERKKIYEAHIRKRCLDKLHIDTGKLAVISDGFIGAEIESVVKDALEKSFVDDIALDTKLLERIAEELMPLSISQKKKIDDYNKKIEELNIKSASI